MVVVMFTSDVNAALVYFAHVADLHVLAPPTHSGVC